MMGMMGTAYPGFYYGYDALLVASVIGWLLFAVVLVILILVLAGSIKVGKKK